jgi:hypothetical protein
MRRRWHAWRLRVAEDALADVLFEREALRRASGVIVAGDPFYGMHPAVVRRIKRRIARLRARVARHGGNDDER